MNNEDIILFSSDDWGWKTSKYQLSIRFSQKNRVLFVSSIGFRSPTASSQDLLRILTKLKSFFRGIRKVADNLYVLTPLVVPFKGIPRSDAINSLLLLAQLRYAKWKLDIKTPYVFVFSQNWFSFVKNIQCKKMIYYCVDDHSGFKGTDAKQFENKDQQMSRIADVIFCSSQKLCEHKKTYNAATFHMSHGVNYDLFSRAVFDNTLEVAKDIQQLPKPILGFYGHISYDWVDVGMLKYLAGNRPEWSILLIGKYSLKEGEFKEFANIHVIGERIFEELPTYCKGMDVGIIPFVKSKLTENCNPLKLYEYLSAGLPVVSTDIPEVRRYRDSVLIAVNKEDFVRCCEVAVADRSTVAAHRRSLSMKTASWNDKITEIYSIIDKLP